jgi:GntR family transcriptional regulator
VLLGSLDRNDDRPVFRQIADQLRGGIDRGVLGPGDRLPSEAELIRHYGVARMTARQAVQELRDAGLVVAEQGKGVFVRPAGRVRRLVSDRFAARHREAEPVEEGAQVDEVQVSIGTAPQPIRERLRLDAAAEVVIRSSRYLADGQPVGTAVSYIPVAAASGTRIMEPGGSHDGIYARLEQAGHDLEKFVEEVTARMPTADERRRLQLAPGTPVLTVLRTAFDTSGHPVEVCDTVKAAPAFVLEYDLPAR